MDAIKAKLAAIVVDIKAKWATLPAMTQGIIIGAVAMEVIHIVF